LLKKLGVGLAVGLLLLGMGGPALAQPISGTNTFEYNNHSHIIAAGTSSNLRTSSGAGLLVNACVNTAGPASSNLTLYDSASGTSATVLAVIDTTIVGCKTYNYSVNTGIVAVLVAASAPPDISIGWR
jgi:hypothetical protein